MPGGRRFSHIIIYLVSNMEAPWFEEPNQRRGGWSGVSRCELDHPDGGKCVIFLKRQENHRCRMLRHPLKGAPTFLREFRHIMHYQDCGVPTLEPVYFGMREVNGDHRAILVTAELTGYVSVEDHVQGWLDNGAPSRMERLKVLAAIARVLKKMHDHGIQHNCFFPKHIFIRQNEANADTSTDTVFDVRIIDLEKSRWRPLRVHCAIRDLYTLNHHSWCWSRSDRLWFFKSYLQIDRLTPYSRWLWRRIGIRSVRKNRVRKPAVMLSYRHDVAD